MSTPQRPVEQPHTADPGWDDERLTAAFVARAARAVVPRDLVPVTIDRVRPTSAPGPWWRRLLPAGAVAALLVAVVGGGLAIVGGPGGLLGGSSGVTFHDGRTPDLRTLDAGAFALDFPADWHGYDATGPYQGTSLAVLSSAPIPCGSDTRLEITCVYERPLEPGEARIVVGVLPYRSGSILDRLDIEAGATTRLSMGGMPAILDERDETPDDFYLADDTATWSIGTPESLTRAVQLDYRAREPEVGAARAAADAIAASFRFTPPPTPLPDDPAAATAASRAMLDAEAASFRQGFVAAGDTDGQTYLDCLPEVPGEDRVVGIDYGPGGDLGWTVLTRCRWFVGVDKNGPFWRIDTVYEWTVNEAFGRHRETYWLDAAGVVVARSSEGDVPPVGDPLGTPGETPTPTAIGPHGTAVISLGQAGDLGQRDVLVVDKTGTLLSARPASEWERGSVIGDIPDGIVRLIDLPDGGVLVRWDGGLCDDAFVLEVDAVDGGRTPDRVTLHGERGGTCRAMGVAWGIRLDFEVDVDVASMAGRNFVVAAAAPQTKPSIAVPDELFGLEIFDVEAALEIQALPGDDREIAVAGWLWRLDPVTTDCFVGNPNEVDELFAGPSCSSDALMATERGGFDEDTLSLALGSEAVATALPIGGRTGGRHLVVLVGHFDDRRSGRCRESFPRSCADRFWVDAVWIDGELLPRDWVIGPAGDTTLDPPIGVADDAVLAAGSMFDDDPTRTMPHDASVLSVGRVPGSALTGIEPTLRPLCGPDCHALFQTPARIWHVTILDRTTSQLRTFVIDDAEFADQGPIVMREPTIDDVLEHTTSTADIQNSGIVFGSINGSDVIPLEEVDLPLYVR